MQSKKIKFLQRGFLVISIIILVFTPAAHFGKMRLYEGRVLADETPSQAIIFYNEACGMCATYVNSALPEMLKKHGINEFIKKDYINNREFRVEMNQLMNEYGVPLPLQSHIMTFVGDKYIIGGHVPENLIDFIFASENQEKFKRIIVYQDEMHGEVKDYKVWAIPSFAENFVGDIKTYPIDTSLDEYFNYLETNKDQLNLSAKVNNQFEKYKSLLPIVLVSGFLDGINPCAFAVLLFFIAFLFSIKKTRASIWKMGIAYIGSMYLAYLLIGFGLMKAIFFTNAPHFMAKFASWLVIGLGIINLIGLVFPKFPIKLRIPHASKETIQKWIHRATVPAALVLGFLVGLCTFPCSGGIYVAIIGLLAAKTTYWAGVNYLLLYNLMFIMPLVIILLLTSNKKTTEKITEWEQSKSKNMKILSAAAMIILGAIILIWFT
jgi:cytochrome c biogenesis protein CcdA